MIVTVYGDEYQCSIAVKGINYVRLYDENGFCFIAFNGISSFDGYEISGGEWTIENSVD